VMRDGRVVHDGRPLAHAEVHTAHHEVAEAHVDHVPRVASPFQSDEESRR